MNRAAKLSQKIAGEAILSEASDIHFIPFEKVVHIYFRVHNKRELYQEIPAHQYSLLLTHYKFTSGMDIGEIQKPQNGTLVFTLDSKKYSLRLSTLPVQTTESLAIRILPQEDSKKLEHLFLFPHQYEQIKQWMTFQSGLFLMTGPTGSGKSTTLYALLRMLMKEQGKQLITLEDPIEQELPGVLQVQLNTKAGITYVEGFKAILRHDPDVVMIGEIRDANTASFAVNAALSGHIVFSTFHAGDAVGTITRLLEMGIDPMDLKEALKGVAAIELVNVKQSDDHQKRSAILELLHETHIQSLINKQPAPYYESFEYLREEAYKYDLI